VALLWQRDRATRLSVEILQLQNIPIVWHYLRDPTFSRFYTIRECDRHTDSRRRHIPRLARLRAVKTIFRFTVKQIYRLNSLFHWMWKKPFHCRSETGFTLLNMPWAVILTCIPTLAAHFNTLWSSPLTFWPQGQCMSRFCQTMCVLAEEV